MKDHGTDAVLAVPLFVDNDFDIDENGVCHLVTMMFVGDDEAPTEVAVELEGVIDAVIEEYGEVDGYQTLYCLAHEFSRMAELMRERASLIEDSHAAVTDLFDA
jgi:hypothetical protein